MIIRRVEVQNFRKLVEPVSIGDLTDGLSIIVGDNEEGKSTVLQAIRSCFFDKHNMTGERAQSFQPYNSSVRPEIRISFEIAGESYVLFKAFCVRPEAKLITPSGVFVGAAAEEQLARLLRFTPPQRARRDAGDHEHEGIFGMFWVEQGRSFAGLNATADGRTTIQQALQHEVGEVLGGRRGQNILAEIAKIRSELLTTAGRPRGEYAEAIEGESNLKQEMATVVAAISDYGRKVEELERCKARNRRYRGEGTLEAARERLLKARAVSDHIADLSRIVEQAWSELAKTRAEHALAGDRFGQRNKLVGQVEAGKEKQKQLRASWDTTREVLERIRGQVRVEDQAVSQAVKAYEDSAECYSKATASEQLARIYAQVESLTRREREALQAKAKAERSLQASSEIGIEKKDIARLKHLDDEVTKSRIQLDALATIVRIELETGMKARLGRAAMVSGIDYRITESTTIDIPTCVRIKINPGGEVGNPLAQLRKGQEKLLEALTDLGISTLGEAELKLEERLSLLTEVKNYRELIAAHAPDGLDALQASVAELRGEMERLTVFVGGKPKTLKETSDALRQAERGLETAAQVKKVAERKSKQAHESMVTAQTQEASARAAYESQETRMQELEEKLGEERKRISDKDLQNAVLTEMQKVSITEQTAIAATKAFEDEDPEAVSLELEAAKGTLTQLEREYHDLDIRIIRLESELRTSGAQGLGERSQQLEVDLKIAHSIVSMFERRSKSVELLQSILVDAEKSAKEAFFRPVTRRIQPYLKLLLPNAELLLGEDLDIAGLKRDGVDEKFAALSIGTREQLAVLTRLAFADLLKENDHPATVLLDDAIVFADDNRFKRMLHILRKAAEKTQIIILSCRERDYEGAGAPIVRLFESCDGNFMHSKN